MAEQGRALHPTDAERLRRLVRTVGYRKAARQCRVALSTAIKYGRPQK